MTALRATMDDSINGGDGNDSILGGQQDDTIYGGSGQDLLDGGTNHDLIYGESDNDTLDGRAGNDTIHGGSGNDIISGGSHDDLLIGGPGDDTIWGGSGADITTFTGNRNDYTLSFSKPAGALSQNIVTAEQTELTSITNRNTEMMTSKSPKILHRHSNPLRQALMEARSSSASTKLSLPQLPTHATLK